MGEAGHDAPAAAAAMKDADDDVFPAWARTVEECEKRFGVDRDRGLSSSDAAARLRAHGPNELQEHPGPSMLQLVAQQFEDTLVRILLATAAVSFALALFSSAEPLILSALEEVGKERNSCKRMRLAGGGDSAAAWRTNRMARAAAGGNDRHSKVVTSRGLWDHYIRIFVPTTIQFYDIKHWLGADQPSKAI